MTIQAVLLPLFVEVILAFVLLYRMAHLRTSAFRKGDINARDVALRGPNWPPHRPGGQRLPQSTRAAGSVLCADDPTGAARRSGSVRSSLRSCG